MLPQFSAHAYFVGYACFCVMDSKNYPNQIYEHGKKIIRDKIIPVEYGKRVPNRTKKEFLDRQKKNLTE